MINHFNFKELDNGTYLLTNDLGFFTHLSKEELYLFLNRKTDKDSRLYDELINKQFILPNEKNEIINQTAPAYRFTKNHLLSSTSLHIFVVTNECNFRCIYCQARNEETHKSGLMSKEISEKAVDIALQSPEKYLNFEFQGGEPLMNFPIIKHIVEYAENKKGSHVIKYSVVTNATLMTDEMIDFCKRYEINLSVSLDGPKRIQNLNRPFFDKRESFDIVKEKIQNLKEVIQNVGAIQTTTKYSLDYPEGIVDQYLELGFDNVFIRPLTCLGTAKEHWEEIGYTAEEFLSFYKKCIGYILKLNKNGVYFREGHASMFVSKILRKQTINYMELRSPCGASIGQIAYYFNGDIFTCDEGRMLSEMGDDSFKLGNVFESDYDVLMSSDTCKALCISSLLESIPGCADCVYQPYCGTCPVVNYAQEKNLYKRNVSNFRCTVYKGMLDIVFDILLNGTSEEKELLSKW